MFYVYSKMMVKRRKTIPTTEKRATSEMIQTDDVSRRSELDASRCQTFMGSLGQYWDFGVGERERKKRKRVLFYGSERIGLLLLCSFLGLSC